MKKTKKKHYAVIWKLKSDKIWVRRDGRTVQYPNMTAAVVHCQEMYDKDGGTIVSIHGCKWRNKQYGMA